MWEHYVCPGILFSLHEISFNPQSDFSKKTKKICLILFFRPENLLYIRFDRTSSFDRRNLLNYTQPPFERSFLLSHHTCSVIYLLHQKKITTLVLTGQNTERGAAQLSSSSKILQTLTSGSVLMGLVLIISLLWMVAGALLFCNGNAMSGKPRIRLDAVGDDRRRGSEPFENNRQLLEFWGRT